MLVLVVTVLTLAGGGAPASCVHNISVEVTNGTKYSNGTLRWKEYTFSPQQYYETSNGALRGCVCAFKQCIRKCCPIGQYYDTKRNCRAKNSTLSDFLSKFKVYDNTTELTVPDDYFEIVASDHCEELAYKLDVTLYLDHYLQANGSLLYPYKNIKTGKYLLFEPEKYCLEEFEEYEQEKSFGSMSAVVCLKNSSMDLDGRYTAITVEALICIPFLLTIFIVYAILPELRNLHGKSLMGHVGTLMVGDVFNLILQYDRNYTSESFCIFNSFISNYLFLASFFWLNIMCIDVWWTFSDWKILKKFNPVSDKCRFKLFNLFVWGMTTIILITSPQFYYLIRYKAFRSRCWLIIQGVKSHFSNVIFLIIFVNVILYSLTTWHIYNAKRETDQAFGKESKKHENRKNKEKYKMYIRLMVLFGLNWIMEFIAWSFKSEYWIWYLAIVFDIFFVVLLFFMLLYKPRVLDLLKRQYPIFRRCFKEKTAIITLANNVHKTVTSNT